MGRLKIRLKDALADQNGAIQAWLNECAERIEPLYNRVEADVFLDMMVYGSMQMSMQEYVEKAQAAMDAETHSGSPRIDETA